ncbi:MAG TPA: hypothetical protein DD387_03655 [Lachnoclostridium sp.]|nr:hypothetical protein [Lachnoclostridium sp.]
MIELVFNEFLNTFPFFILAYLPVCDRMRFAFKKSFLMMCIWESVYLCLFSLLVIFGLSSVSAQYLAIPVLFALMMFLVDADIGITAFLFLFTVDYLLVIRGATFYLCQKIFHVSFLSWQAGAVTLILTLTTVFFMSKFLKGILSDLLSVRLPDFWKTAWLLPCSATVMVLLLTGNIRNGNVKSNALIARILLLVCMFLISHLILLFIRNLQEQIIEQERNKTMENLLKMQRKQSEELQVRIKENRRARHDFRQHRAVIRDLANRGDLDSLKNYLEEYEQQFPDSSDRLYCGNLALNAVLSYYADQAKQYSIPMTFKIDLPEKLLIPETDFCVLIGNLLENALEACKAQASDSFIRVLIQQNQMSSITVAVDNSSSCRPVWDGQKLLSTKHPGNGIGTDSVRYIAKRYKGGAHFEWKDGVFYASVMLNLL